MSIYIILLLALISFAVFVLGVFYLMTRHKKITMCICFFFVAVGFSIYTAGFLSSGESVTDILLATLRGAFNTAQMFFLNDDYSFLVDVKGIDWLTNNKWMQIIFWLSHISVLALIQGALISLFGRKLTDSFRLRFGPHDEVYIIKGNDKNAFLLAENIVTPDAPDREEKHPGKKRLIVILSENDKDEKESHENAAHFDGIVQALDKDHDLKYYLNKAGLGKRNWPRKEKKYHIILMPKNESAPEDVRLIAKFAKEKDVKQNNLDIFVFISSEWDREKIEEITQAKEDKKRTYPYTFHIINEVDLLVRQMLEKHPPFKCPGLGFSGGVASRNFTVMILGFGTVGQSALLRLVMNGQFVGSRMHAVIVDKNIDKLHNYFSHRYPGLKLCCNMEPENFDVQSEEFFTLLDKKSNVDYVVIALCNDETNKQTAMDIKLHYERKGIKALPFIAVSEKNGISYEAKDDKQDEKIFTFGCREDIYKESVIIREKADRMAKAVNEVYNIKVPEKAKPWNERVWFEQESNRATADFIPAMLELADLTRDKVPQEGPLVKNKDTLVNVLAQTEHLRWNAFHAAMGWNSIGIEEMRQRFNSTSSKEPTARLHVCLVSWDKLDEISEAYKENFKSYDY
jgi:hypothetical protein